LLLFLLACDGPERPASAFATLEFSDGESARWASFDTQQAACASVVIDHKHGVISVHIASDLVGAILGDYRWVEHEYAIPRTNVDATLAEDAKLGDQTYVSRRFPYGFQPGAFHLLRHVIGPKARFFYVVLKAERIAGGSWAHLFAREVSLDRLGTS
jgi:hypothetical protein